MKRTLLALLLILGISTASHAQYVAIPDVNFGIWLNTHGYATCMTGNSSTGWMLDTTCNKVLTDTSINCYNSYISNLTGISYFVSLKRLDCSYNLLTSLPSLPNSLIYLWCSGNQLTSLPSLPSSLTYLNCYYNQLTSLPSLPSSLTVLECSSNQLTSLPSLPNSLYILYCNNNQLTSLPSLPNSLTDLYCFSNQLTSLPSLPNSLTQLDCRYNQLTSLPSLPSSLYDLSCSYNQLTSLPSLPSFLYDLDCSHNQLTSLPSLPKTLITLKCSSNQNISCLSTIYINYLYEFYISGTSITCLPNRFTASSYDINPNTLPLCTPMTGCDFYYNIAGDIHSDTSINCTQDSLHPAQSVLRNMKVQLKKNGQVIQQFYTDNSGQYSFKTDSLSSYEVTVDTTGLPFTIACPSSGSLYDTLTATDSIHINDNFGLTCKGVTDYAAISIFANRFRPAFQTLININAGNLTTLQYGGNCGAGIAGKVTTILSPSVHFISPASGALTPTSIS
jgi:hypothetical protein